MGKSFHFVRKWEEVPISNTKRERLLIFDELVRYNPSEFYDIKVIKKRKTKKGVEYLVNFIGYPESMNQWVKASDLKNQ